MDLEKIGKFIKQLRSENDMSQQKLADLIPIDRASVSRWESGKVQPPVDKIKILCNIFNVSFDELISGERNSETNKKDHEKNLFDYLISQDAKYRKLKIVSIVLIALLFISSFMFLLYYFTQTYKSESVYRIYGSSDNYEIKDGLLVITRENSYLKIGAINDQVLNIKLYYKENNDNKIFYEGSSDVILPDFYGYNVNINNRNITNILDNLYVMIENEEIKLNFKKDYFNENLLLEDKTQIGDTENINDDENTIPNKLKNEFKCNDEVCKKTVDNVEVEYMIDLNTFYIRDKNCRMQYELDYNIFSYDDSKNSFTYDGKQLNCSSGSCENYENLYKKYYLDLIEKYIK